MNVIKHLVSKYRLKIEGNITFFANYQLFNVNFQSMLYFLGLLLLLQVSCDEERRIDWVGEPNHAQPQDANIQSSNRNNQPERIRNLNDATQAPIFENIIEGEEDDLQQRQQPESILPVFGKGTYLEFVEQQKLDP